MFDCLFYFPTGNCVDYDLCHKCEAKTAHNPTHVFLKVKTPLPAHAASSQPELIKNVYTNQASPGGPSAPPCPPPAFGNYGPPPPPGGRGGSPNAPMVAR